MQDKPQKNLDISDTFRKISDIESLIHGQLTLGPDIKSKILDQETDNSTESNPYNLTAVSLAFDIGYMHGYTVVPEAQNNSTKNSKFEKEVHNLSSKDIVKNYKDLNKLSELRDKLWVKFKRAGVKNIDEYRGLDY
ncbi:MAG: hypothetical protein MHPSP_001367 [Paramarteilia canceri]